MHARLIALAAASTLGSLATAAHADVVVVSAAGNSSSGGTAATSTLTFTAGQGFRVRSSTDDLWSAGSLPRYSDANGLVANRLATATDDSGQPVGTQIGADFGPYTQDGFTAPYGSLVARFGGVGGTYQLLGANFTGFAAGNGPIELFYWDSNSFDNSGDIRFDFIAGIPEPASWALMILGFGVIGGAMRARRRQVVRFSFA